ncbi:hypothetical protein TNCV_860981 [Trichonephila clavipes]|nr:hypothetical protein TNCV_860981 [Trichonephila clavipes]
MSRCFDIHLWIRFTPNAAVLFVDVAIQPEVRFIAKQNSLMKSSKIGRPDWTTSEPAVAVICQKSYLKCLCDRLLTNVALQNNTRAIGDGPRDFGQPSSYEEDIPVYKYPRHANERTESSDTKPAAHRAFLSGPVSNPFL